MAVMIRTVGTKTSTTVKYNQWINDIVLKGDAHKFDVIRTWDLVMVRKKTNGVFKNLEITEIDDAKNLQQQFPLEYDYVAFNEDAQIKKDIAKSNKIKNWPFLFVIRNNVVAIIRPIKKNIKHISLAEWILIGLSILTILIMTGIIKIN